jgi:hypothetical protein
LSSDWIRKFTPKDQQSIDIVAERRELSAKELRVENLLKQRGKF